jgi:hypothetical protein
MTRRRFTPDAALATIGAFVAYHGYAPDAVDLATYLRCDPRTARALLRALSASGQVRRVDRTHVLPVEAEAETQP